MSTKKVKRPRYLDVTLKQELEKHRIWDRNYDEGFVLVPQINKAVKKWLTKKREQFVPYTGVIDTLLEEFK